MPFHCILIDPLADKGVVRPYGVGSDGYPMFECLRLLMGVVNIQNNETEKVTKLRRCYVTQTDRRLGRNTLDQLVKTIFESDISTEDFGTYLTRGGNDNRSFWEKVKSELCLCLVAEKCGQSLHAFLHLYRIIELISVALPLVYASSEPDYKKALALLKSLNENDGGELAVLRSLAGHITKSGGYEELTISFDFMCVNDVWRVEASRQFRQYVLSPGSIGETRDDHSGFDVSFANIPSLVVNTRNRIFHRKITGKNFDLDKLDGVDDLCKTVTGPTLYWLSLTIIEILKVHSTRYV